MVALGTSSGNAAGGFAAGRSAYPASAVAWALDGHGLDVIHVGASSGALTAELVRQGHRVIAVDSDERTLAALATVAPGVPRRVGTIEAIPLPDDSADALVCSQAWRWVHAAASREASRVLRSGGRLALLWNAPDERTHWVARLSRVVKGPDAASALARGGPSVVPPLVGLDTMTFSWSADLTADGVRAMVHSRSYYIAGDEGYKARVDAGLSELFASTPQLAEGGTVTVPFVTHAFRAVRSARG